jgi:peptide-methionine (S)-S-oxide reductase
VPVENRSEARPAAKASLKHATQHLRSKPPPLVVASSSSRPHEFSAHDGVISFSQWRFVMSENNQPGSLALATLGGGCFWCLQPAFQELKGVHEVTVGYAGGHVEDPSYEQVCTGRTGHAEVVQVAFDPAEIAFEDILRIFFTLHDPTTLNRQGNDVGPQYRSIILFDSPEQEAAAHQVIAEIDDEGLWRGPLVTQVEPLQVFFPAETYHQDYFAKNPNQGYCRAIIAPKVAKFRSHYADRLKTTAA